MQTISIPSLRTDKDFVTEETAGKASRLEAKGSSIVSYGVIVTVDREGLRQRLERDGVL